MAFWIYTCPHCATILPAMKRYSLLALPLCVALLFAAPLSAQAVPTFVGVRTFLGAPYVTNLEKLDADFAVLGVPFDEGTWGQPGERYGPRDMREASQEYNHDLTEGFYYIDGDRTVLKGKHWVDVGDIEVWPTVPAQTDGKITAAVRKILANKAFPIILGGGHSITFPVMRDYEVPYTMDPGGLNFSEIDDLLMGVAAKGRLVGMDIVEVNPYRDPSGRTAQTAVRLLVDTLGAAFR